MIDRNRRTAFTLLEMLVVLGIMLMLAALTAYLYRGFAANSRLVRGTDQLTQWLVLARERARLDGRETGLQVVPPDDGTSYVTRFRYVQTPEPLAGGTLLMAAGTKPPPGSVHPFWASAGTYLQGGALLPGSPMSAASTGPLMWGLTLYNVDATQVTTGDFLIIRGGPSCYVMQAAAMTHPDGTPGVSLTVLNPPLDLANPGGPTTNYQLVRSPRLLIGEDDLVLPADIGVNLTRCVNLPPGRPVNAPSMLLFKPSGERTTGGGPGGQTVYWLADREGVSGDPGSSALVVVTPSGRVSQQPVAPGDDPYANTRDARDGGM